MRSSRLFDRLATDGAESRGEGAETGPVCTGPAANEENADALSVGAAAPSTMAWPHCGHLTDLPAYWSGALNLRPHPWH